MLSVLVRKERAAVRQLDYTQDSIDAIEDHRPVRRQAASQKMGTGTRDDVDPRTVGSGHSRWLGSLVWWNNWTNRPAFVRGNARKVFNQAALTAELIFPDSVLDTAKV
jgi:hypothetical protein